MDIRESSLKLAFKRTKTLLVTFTVTFFVLVCAYAAFEKRDVDLDKTFLAKEHKIFVSGQKRLINNELNERVSDLLYLKENAVFRNYINGNGSKEDVENEWLLFGDKMKKYDQIRYIDAKGNEKIRSDCWFITDMIKGLNVGSYRCRQIGIGKVNSMDDFINDRRAKMGLGLNKIVEMW